jgi:hypothetical protein
MQKDRSAKRMQKHIGCLWVVGFFGLLAAANAQTPSPPAANTQFDGTYAPVSATTLNETFMAGGTRPGQCPERKAEPLTIMQAQARYSSRRVNGTARLQREGTVESHGDLKLRREPEPEGRHGGIDPGFEFFAYGRIDGNGTARVRQIGSRCNFEFTWQKVKVQSPSLPIASASFDGTYAFVSSTRLNETYLKRVTGRTDQCPEREAGTLTIINGQADLPLFAGTIGSHGELAMVLVREPTDFGETLGGTVSGAIDKAGTVKARRTIGDCSYDTIWQKDSK